MFTFKLTEVDTGEETTVKADSRDVLVWEKTSRSGESYTDLITGLSMSKLYRLAYLTAKRQDMVVGKLAEFEEKFLLDIEMEDVLPTAGTPSTEK